jgi:Fic family protein
MKEFNYQSLVHMKLSMDLVNTISTIHEYRGKEELYLQTNPQSLERLIEIAKIQSTGASNKIEGISTTDLRLRALVQKKVEPKNRDEEEIAGYREALSIIHDSHEYIAIKQNDILTLHKYLYRYTGSSFGGNYKLTDNVIQDRDGKGNVFVRFKPASAFLTPSYMESLCISYNDAVKKHEIDPLIIIPCFILDFLSIHPFNDGNGRMSRLLTTLLMYQANYMVGKYISIEAIVEKTKESYYDALLASSTGWHENANDYNPFIKYLLGVIIAAYKDFESRFELMTPERITSADRVFEAIGQSLNPTTKGVLLSLLPDISQKTVERSLNTLLKEEKIRMIGQGKLSAYIHRK